MIVELEINLRLKLFLLLFRMLMSKRDRLAIYEVLFKDGVIVALKVTNSKKNASVESVSNLCVIKECNVRYKDFSFSKNMHSITI